MGDTTRAIMTDQDVKSKLRGNVAGFKKLAQSAQTQHLVAADSEMRFALDRVLGDPTGKLRECTQDSLARSFLSVSSIGLSLNPILQYAAFIPRWNKDIQKFECQLMPMYRGLIKLATDTGIIKAVKAENVYSADTFEIWDESGTSGYKHKVNTNEERNTDENYYIGTYVTAHLNNPPPPYVFEWVPVEDMDKIRDSSENYKADNPKCVWVKWEDEMRRKAAIKRAQKYWPRSEGIEAERFSRAVHLDNVIEGQSTIVDLVKPAKQIEVKRITTDQVKELTEAAKVKKIDPSRICKAYFIDNLTLLPADKFTEVKERIAGAKDNAAPPKN